MEDGAIALCGGFWDAFVGGGGGYGVFRTVAVGLSVRGLD